MCTQPEPRTEYTTLNMATVVDTLHALKNHLLAVRLNLTRARGANDPTALDQLLTGASDALEAAIDDLYQLIEAGIANGGPPKS